MRDCFEQRLELGLLGKNFWRRNALRLSAGDEATFFCHSEGAAGDRRISKYKMLHLI
jgi:hypothetical protein